MKVKIEVELNYETMLFLSRQVAREDKCQTSQGWWDAADAPQCNKDTIATLYEYAHADGMQAMLDIIEKMKKEGEL